MNLRDNFFVVAAQLSPGGQKKCKDIFTEIEQKSLDDMLLAYGGVELLKYLKDNGIKRAVLTRNREKNVYHMRDLYLSEMKKTFGSEEEEDILFDTIVARDTKSHESATEPLKSKPDPAGILHICKVWGCDPKETIMVGDNENDDIMAANRACCGGSVLVTQEGGEVLDTCSGYSVGDTEEEILLRTPSLKVESLLELKNHLEENANRRSEIDKKMGRTYKPQPALAHSTDTFSVEVPSIGVKSV